MTYSGEGVRVLRARLPILVATIGLAAYACSAPSGDAGQGDLDAGVLALALERSAAGAPGSGEEGSSSASASGHQGTAALTAASPPPVSQYVAPYLPLATDTQASCPSGFTLLLGTENSDVLNSASPNRCVVAFGAADTVASSGNNATVLLGAGDDILMAGPGAKIKGGAGSDTVNGFSGGIVRGDQGADIINAANGNNQVWPGEGKDETTFGTGSDIAVVAHTCEIVSGEKLNGYSGVDKLVTPVPVSQLQALGATVTSFETIVIENNACHSSCSNPPACVHGWCVPGSGAQDMQCSCEDGWIGPLCDQPACSDEGDNDTDSLRNCDEDDDLSGWTDKNIFNGSLVAEAPICHVAPACSLIDTRSEIEACYDAITIGEERALYSGWDFANTQSLELCDPEYGFAEPWSGCPVGQNGAEPFQLHYQGRIYLPQAGQHCFAVAGSATNACGSFLVGAATSAITSASGATCFSLAAGEHPIRAFYESAGVPTQAAPHFEADFAADAAGFVYFDDQFRSTNKPAYASGAWNATGGSTTGGVTVTLGGVDDLIVTNMSGGWKRTVTLAEAQEFTLSFRYKMTTGSEYETDEYSEVLASVDGVLRGLSGNDYVHRLSGDNNGGPVLTTGWQLAQIPLGTLSAGDHTLVLGGFNNKKTLTNEVTTLQFDDVVLRPTVAVTGGGSFSLRYCFGNTTSCTPTAAIPSSMLRLPEGVCGPNVCTVDCPCDPGGTCDTDSDCKEGLVCGEDNGRHFGKPAFDDHCWGDVCEASVEYGGCGNVLFPCGICDPKPDPCVTSADCTVPGDVCGQGNGVYFGLEDENVCWAPLCDDQQADFCGRPGSPCGDCICVPEPCSECGGDDGCGRNCTGQCDDGDPCQRDSDCGHPSICFHGTCRPPTCLDYDPTAPNCGLPPNLDCGPCNDCTGTCGDRECGLAPGCGNTTCGPNDGACSNPGDWCNAEGQCVGPGDPPPERDPTSEVGEVGGSFQVSDRGEASYAIPLITPPGRNGMQPRFAIAYQGNKLDGPLGLGWTLAGLSRIERCNKTVAQDKKAEPPAFNILDAFCLDGQRLIVIGPVADPSNLIIEYKTEVDSFQRITQVVPAGGATSFFRVESANGLVSTYGASKEASIEVPFGDSTDPLKQAWLLERVQDRRGNHVDYSYRHQYAPAEGNPTRAVSIEALVEVASYGGFLPNGTPHDREVRFHYADRPDGGVTQWRNGLRFVQKSRLFQIDFNVRGSLVRQYKLGYPAINPTTPALSSRLLSQVEECVPDLAQGGSLVCKPPTTFGYETDSSPFEPGIAWQHDAKGPIVDIVNYPVSVLDLDGFGRDSLMYTSGWFKKGEEEFETWQLSFSRSGMTPNLIDTETDARLRRGHPLDFNGDGVTDYLSRTPDCTKETSGQNAICTLRILTRGFGETGDLVAQQVGIVYFGEPVLAPPLIADLDGDGYKDIVAWRKPAQNWPDHAVFLGGPKDEFGHYFTQADTDWVIPPILEDATYPHRSLLDLNGDGKTEIIDLEYQRTDWKVYHVTVDRTQDPPLVSALAATLWQGNTALPKIPMGPSHSIFPSGKHFKFDFNNDGLPDHFDGTLLWSSTGTRLITSYPFKAADGTPVLDPSGGIGVFDYTGDGRVDGAEKLANGSFVAYPTAGDSVYLVPQATGVAMGSRVSQRGDFDGDSNWDVVTYGVTSAGAQTRFTGEVYFGRVQTAQLLTSVTEGVGKRIEIEYAQTIQDSANSEQPVYTRCFPQDSTDSCGEGKQELVRTPGALVSTHKESLLRPNGPPKLERSSRYRYFDGRIGRGGRGPLGFGKRIVETFDGTDTFVRRSTIEYRNDEFPFAGRPLRVRTEDALTPGVEGVTKDSLHSTEVTTPWIFQPGRPEIAPFQVVLQNRITTEYETDPLFSESKSLVVRFTERPTYDDFGNVIYTSVDSETTQGRLSLETTRTAYKHAGTDGSAYLAAWLVALPERQVTNGLRGETPTVVRARSARFYYDVDRLEELERVEQWSGDLDQAPTLESTTHFLEPDQFRNRTVTKTVAEDDPGVSVERVVTMGFAGNGFYPTEVTNALGHVASATYDDRLGVQTSATDPNGITTVTRYDSFGRVTTLLDGRGQERENRSYEQANGSPGTEPPIIPGVQNFTSPATAIYREHREVLGGSNVDIYRDGFGRTVKTQSIGFRGVIVNSASEYDQRGLVVAQSRPHTTGDATQDTQGVVRTERDNRGRALVTHFPDGTCARQFHFNRYTTAVPFSNFDVFDSRIAVYGSRVEKRGKGLDCFNAVAQTTSTDHRGNLISAEDALGTDTDYAYEGFGAVVRVLHERGGPVETLIEHDNFGRVTSQTDPDMGLHRYFYNGFGDLKRREDPRDIVEISHYDILGRPTGQSVTQGSSTEQSVLHYDAASGAGIGMLDSSQSFDGVQIVYDYVPAGQLGEGQVSHVTQRTDVGTQFSASYAYDGLDRPARIDYPSSPVGDFAVTYEYDEASGALEFVKSPDGLPYWALQQAYQGILPSKEEFGPKTPSNPNNVVTETTFDPVTGRVERLESLFGSTLVVQDLQYDYWDDGNLKLRTDNAPGGVTERFGYDELHRLKTVHRDPNGTNDLVHKYTYHPNGNLHTSSDIAGGGTYSYDPVVRPHAVSGITGPGGTWAFGHDAVGNQTSRTLSTGYTQTLDFTSFNLPRTVTTDADGSGGTAPIATHFKYTSSNQRVQKSSPAGVTDYFAELYERTTDTTAGETKHKYFVTAGGKKVAQFERTEVAGLLTDERTHYIHGDLQGSSMAITPALVTSQSDVVRQKFTPFGKPEQVSYGVTPGYTGYEHDDDLGLINARGRMYDPAMGRFLSADPIVQAPESRQSLNRYSYVMNNPLNLVDPGGFTWKKECQADDCTIIFDDDHLTATPSSEAPPEVEDNEGGEPPVGPDGEPGTGPGGGPDTGTKVEPPVVTEPPRVGPGEAVTVPGGGPSGSGAEAMARGEQTYRYGADDGRRGGDVAAREVVHRMMQAEQGSNIQLLGQSTFKIEDTSGTWETGLDIATVFTPGTGLLSAALKRISKVLLVAKAAKGGGKSVSLFRAVGDAELKVIQASGGKIPASLSGAEVKYFSATAEGASSYARQAVRGFGDAPYTLIETRISRSSLPANVLHQVDRNVPAVVLPNSYLPSLAPAQVWTYMPVP